MANNVNPQSNAIASKYTKILNIHVLIVLKHG